MRILVLIFFIIGSSRVQSKCAHFTDNDLLEESKFLAVGEIISSDFKYDKKSSSCQWKEKKLTYKLKITEVISGKMYPGEYTLSYLHNCLEKPTDEVFEVSSKYIFSIKSLSGSEIQLSELKCKRWGWAYNKLPEIKSSIQKYCNDKNEILENMIKDSKSCSKDSDCDYIAYMSPGRNRNTCHHFVNKSKISNLNEHILKLEAGVCGITSAVLCKAPMKKFISCRNGQCYFPYGKAD